MKIFVKTLKGDRFEILVNPDDSVADLKKNVEAVLGVTASYPAAEQVLIHKGKVLKDETTLEATNVSEKSIIGVMKRKPASTGTSTASANLKAQAHAAPPTEPSWDAASNVNYENNPESNIQRILEMVRRAGSRETVGYSSASNDLYEDLDYLHFGLRLPVQSETDQEPERPSVADLERALNFVRYNEEYESLRALAQSDPSLLMDFVETLEEYSPSYYQFIRDNKPDFLRLLLEEATGGDEREQPHEHQGVQTNEPNNGGDGDNQVGESKETKVEVATPEDDELIARLEALGFERGDAEVAYKYCSVTLFILLWLHCWDD